MKICAAHTTITLYNTHTVCHKQTATKGNDFGFKQEQTDTNDVIYIRAWELKR